MIGILTRLLTALVLSRLGGQKLVTFLAKPKGEDLILMRDLMATGEVTPVIDRRYKLSEIREAIRYVGEGHARGKTVITF